VGSILKSAFKAGKTLYPLLSPLLAKDENGKTRSQLKGLGNGGAPLALHNSVSLSFPTAYGSAHHRDFGHGMSLVGSDFIAALEVPATCEQGTILLNQRIQPSLFTNTRLAQFAPLFERYKFKRLVFIYEPIANATDTGQVIGLVDLDPSDVWDASAGLTNVRRAASYAGNMSHQVWDCGTYLGGSSDPFTDLYTNPAGTDIRMTDAGQLVILAGSSTSISAGSPMGNIYMMYEVEFYLSCLDPAQALNIVGSFYWSGTSANATPIPDNITQNWNSLGAEIQSSSGGASVINVPVVRGGRYIISAAFGGTNPVVTVSPSTGFTIDSLDNTCNTAALTSTDKGCYATETGTETILCTYVSGTITSAFLMVSRADPIQLTEGVVSFQQEILTLKGQLADLKRELAQVEIRDDPDSEMESVSVVSVLKPMRRR